MQSHSTNSNDVTSVILCPLIGQSWLFLQYATIFNISNLVKFISKEFSFFLEIKNKKIYRQILVASAGLSLFCTLLSFCFRATIILFTIFIVSYRGFISSYLLKVAEPFVQIKRGVCVLE